MLIIEDPAVTVKCRTAIKALFLSVIDFSSGPVAHGQ
jgi:hypothetical protein